MARSNSRLEMSNGVMVGCHRSCALYLFRLMWNSLNEVAGWQSS